MQFLFADLEQQVTSLGTKAVVYGAIVLVTAIVIASLLKDKAPKLKLPLFLIMATALVGVTFTLIGSTVYLNTKSESGGPVHWHTDVEYWACGTEIEFRDPHGFLSNKIGTATYHEHNDKRIHLEGVVVRKDQDASLEKFMRVTGGFLQDDAIAIPLNDSEAEWFVSGDAADGDATSIDTDAGELKSYVHHGQEGPVMKLANGQTCGGNRAELQAFVYRYNKEDDTYAQTKLANPKEYIMRDESQVPPGDCLIIEFDTPKAATERLCEQYGVRDVDRCTEFGVKEFSSDVCYARQVNVPSRDPAQLFNTFEDRCQDYLENKGDPLYRPGLTSDEINSCEGGAAE